MVDKETTPRTCPVCGTVYRAEVERLKHGRQTTCSRACSYAFRFSNNQRKPDFRCAVCGREFSRSPSHVKSKHGGQFCSRACHYAGRATGATRRVVTQPYSVTDAGRAAWLEGGKKAAAKRRARNNYGHTEATRRKLSIATARHLAKSKRYNVSKLEDKVAAQLDALGIAYERQRAFRDSGGRFAFVVDFWLIAERAALEVNGTYWHADPRVYPGPLNATQQRCVAKYRRKVESLQASGIPLVEVWEVDLKQRPAEAVIEAYTRLA